MTDARRFSPTPPPQKIVRDLHCVSWQIMMLRKPGRALALLWGLATLVGGVQDATVQEADDFQLLARGKYGSSLYQVMVKSSYDSPLLLMHLNGTRSVVTLWCLFLSPYAHLLNAYSCTSGSSKATMQGCSRGRQPRTTMSVSCGAFWVGEEGNPHLSGPNPLERDKKMNFSQISTQIQR
jgi:hypothetical protein